MVQPYQGKDNPYCARGIPQITVKSNQTASAERANTGILLPNKHNGSVVSIVRIQAKNTAFIACSGATSKGQ